MGEAPVQSTSASPESGGSLPTPVGPVENVVIIGSGPAGYTAAIYAARANLNPLLITGFQAGGIPGGQLMTTTHVENYPGFPDGILGPELMDRMKAQAVRWGTHLVEADAEELALNDRPFRSGPAKGRPSTARPSSLPPAPVPTDCTCPARNNSGAGASVPVQSVMAPPPSFAARNWPWSGGDSACEEAVYLTKYGSRVHLIVRSDRLRASAAMADRVIANPAIQVHWNRELVDVAGEGATGDTDWLATITLRDRIGGGLEELPVRGLFYAIGHTPNTALLQGQIPLDERGYLITRPGRPETELDGVFAAGDVADAEWRQGITAAASGCQAALAAERWLTHRGLAVTVRREDVDPAPAGEPVRTAESDAANYTPEALWQKGAYALRKLYHDSPRPLLVVYTSPSCGPCHVLKPQLRRVLQELEGRAQGVEIDIEADPEIAQQAGVSGTPTVQLFFQKEMKQQWRGVKQRREFLAAIEALTPE